MKKNTFTKILICLSLILFIGIKTQGQIITKGITGDVILDSTRFEAIPYKGSTEPPANYFNTKNIKKLQGAAIDSIKTEVIIPKGDDYSIRLNYQPGNFSFTEIPPSVNLTADALAAIACSPLWIQNDLYDNLRRLSTAQQNLYAAKIINADTLYRDEVAFQIAHLAPLTLNSMNKNLPVVNAQGIYQIAPELQYVKLVEHGSAASGDWYTTTTYRIIDNNNDTVWREIPKEIYYSWVLMPILSDELPLMSSTVYNEFWRTHVYYHADTIIDTLNNDTIIYPLLRNVLTNIKVVWDGKTHIWENKDSLGPAPFCDSLFAVQAIGRWVAQTLPAQATLPRPIQPNQILHDHDGNCGEIQDLLNAGARAGLLPVLSVGSWPGDHVWCELYWPDFAKWVYYQVDWACGVTRLDWNQTYPEKGCITGWRADGYRWMVNEHYNPTCTLTVVVIDSLSKPIDGAEIVFFSAPYYNPHGNPLSFPPGSWGHTNKDGELTVLLGTGINYGIRADWQKGHDPATSTSLYSIPYTDLIAGGHIWRYLTPGGNMPAEPQLNQLTDPELGLYSLGIEYEIPYYTIYGGGYWQYNFSYDNFQYSQKIDLGKINFFICDTSNYNLFSQDSLFNAYENFTQNFIGEYLFGLPAEEDFYINLSNKNKNCASKFANMKVYLFNGPAEISESESITSDMIVFPNPSITSTTIQFPNPNNENHALTIYNATGQEVQTIKNITGPEVKVENINWGSGLYFFKLQNEKGIAGRGKFIIE